MPHSLKNKVKSLCYKGEITEKERDRLIQALEQEPSEDCISRKDTLNRINTLLADYILIMPTGWTLPLNIAKTINKMPSVTPQQPRDCRTCKQAGILCRDYF